MRDNDFIVSKTDLKGRITYANHIFMEFAGYSARELYQTQHNIIRHPDMPRGVFALMWETIQSGREFNGYVKNLSADGGFYWVWANITPSYDAQNNIIGYYSVRRKPKQNALREIEKLYQEMLRAEKNAGPRQAIAVSTQLLQDKLKPYGLNYDEFVHAL